MTIPRTHLGTKKGRNSPKNLRSGVRMKKVMTKDPRVTAFSVEILRLGGGKERKRLAQL